MQRIPWRQSLAIKANAFLIMHFQSCLEPHFNRPSLKRASLSYMPNHPRKTHHPWKPLRQSCVKYKKFKSSSVFAAIGDPHTFFKLSIGNCSYRASAETKFRPKPDCSYKQTGLAQIGQIGPNLSYPYVGELQKPRGGGPIFFSAGGGALQKFSLEFCRVKYK